MDTQNFIFQKCMDSKEKSPLNIVGEIFKNPDFPQAGKDHHSLVAACMISAYANTSELNDNEKKELLEKGIQKADCLPGGFCAGYGADAAAISLGISVSVILGNNIKAETAKGRGKAHTLTGMGMLDIANNHGNRCCRRSTYSMLILGTNYFNQSMGVNLEEPRLSKLKCSLRDNNPLCNQEYCKFY